MENNSPNLQSPRVNTLMTQLIYPYALEPMVKSLHRRSCNILHVRLGLEGSRGILPPFQGLKDRITILCSPSINVSRSKHVWQHEYEWSDFTIKLTVCTCGDQVQISRLLHFQRCMIWHNRCSNQNRFCSSRCWGVIQMHISVIKHWSKNQKCNIRIFDSIDLLIWVCKLVPYRTTVHQATPISRSWICVRTMSHITLTQSRMQHDRHISTKQIETELGLDSIWTNI